MTQSLQSMEYLHLVATLLAAALGYFLADKTLSKVVCMTEIYNHTDGVGRVPFGWYLLQLDQTYVSRSTSEQYR
jgi:hypothetical protein